MANAVVAVFDEYNEAQSAVNELLVAGFEKNEVKLSGNGDAATLQTEGRRGKPGIKKFFKSLFNKEQEDKDIRLYDEAVRHGNFVVTAIAETDEKSDIASEVMSHHHPVDLDERAPEWLAPKGTPMPLGEDDVKLGGVRIFEAVTITPLEEGVVLREEQVVVEPLGDDDYRAHWKQMYADEGGTYEEFLPAYEYGSTAAGSRQFKGRDWETVEPDLKRDWEARNPGSAWDRFKASIRHAFERLRK